MLKNLQRACIAGFMAAAACAASLAHAQEAYPRQVINFICAFPAGSGADVLVRFWANKLAPIAGATIVVQNKPGAMANIAAEFTARSKPDGYNILIHAGSSIAGNMHVFKNPPMDVVKELKVVATLSRHSYMLIVGKNSPHKSLQDLTAALKTKGEKASYGTSNTSSFIIGELYKRNAGLKVVQVNYRTSADFVNDLTSGAIDFAVVDSIAGISLDKQGHWKMLAVGSGERMASTPDLPTFADGGTPGIDVVTWWGAMAPAATPQPIVEKIHAWFNEAMKSPETVEFLKAQGNDVYPTSIAEGAGQLSRSEKQWKELVELAKVEKL
ncbi:MAG: hypothetical protein JWN93_2383 [Hyphomicrobiales bacterium]|nr:hypothetical protein [Hyphomicrobiales bacterium]